MRAFSSVMRAWQRYEKFWQVQRAFSGVMRAFSSVMRFFGRPIELRHESFWQRPKRTYIIIFFFFFSTGSELATLRHIETRLGGTTEMSSEAILASEALEQPGNETNPPNKNLPNHIRVSFPNELRPTSSVCSHKHTSDEFKLFDISIRLYGNLVKLD